MWIVVPLLGCKPETPEPDLCPEDPGTVCVVAGNGTTGFSGDGGAAREASMYRPTDVTLAPNGDLVVVDWNNHRVRSIDSDGVIETLVGTLMPGDGPADQSDREPPGAPGTEVSLNHPVQVEFDADGVMWLPNWHNHKIRSYDPATGNTLVVVADTGPDDGNGANAGFGGDEGPAEDALVFFPVSAAFGPDGTMYFVDQKNLRVRTVDAAGIIHTVAGAGTFGFAGDGADALLASFSFVDSTTNPQPEPAGAIEVDDTGVVYIADSHNHCIRKIDPTTGFVDSIAGTGAAGMGGDGGPALSAQLDMPTDIELGPDGRLYVMDTNNHRVRAIDLASGTIETVFGTGEDGATDEGGLPTETAIARAWGIEFDAEGALLVADTYNDRILRVTP
jgi:sugar lactone lactonase YvrE